MLSESARIKEARFRVQAPNSLPRAITVIALDAAGEAVIRRLADSNWTQATFLTALSPDTACDLAGQTRSSRDEVDAADLVVLVAGPGGRAHAASTVGQACSVRCVMTTGCVVGAGSAPESDLSRTLAQLRPWSLMVVIAKDDEYIHDMMTALRA
jgi:hypothetical protein